MASSNLPLVSLISIYVFTIALFSEICVADGKMGGDEPSVLIKEI
jgi:hypothetical protein